jgi:hypothetical protein
MNRLFNITLLLVIPGGIIVGQQTTTSEPDNAVTRAEKNQASGQKNVAINITSSEPDNAVTRAEKNQASPVTNTGTTTAQTSNTTIKNAAEAETEQLNKDLKLNAVQFASVLQINIDYQTKLGAIDKNNATYSAKFKDIEDTYVKSLLNEFTPEQIEQYKKIHTTN